MRRAAAWLALAVATGGCLRPRGTPEEPVVTRFTLKGVKAVDAGVLRDRLATQATTCRPLCDVKRLDPDALAVDRRRVEAFYRERGWYGATVESVEVTPDGEGRVRVVMRVREGEPVRVRRLTVTGLDEAPEARARAGKLPLREGAIFAEEAFDATRAKLLSALRATGWARAEVTQRAEVRPEEGAAEVTYEVAAGGRYRFGHAFVAGTAAVPRERVVDEAEREARPGSWYDEGRVTRVQSRIFDLGVFAGVRVVVGEPDPERGTLPVVVTVREAPLRTVRAGPGLGFQSTRWEVQGQASWTHRNFMGGLRKLQVEGRAGYAWIPTIFRRDREGTVGLVSAEFTQPDVIAHQLDLTTRVEVEKSLEQDYGFWSERLRVGTPVRLAPRWTLAPTFNLEVYQLNQLASPDVIGLPQFRSCPNQVCLLSYLEQRLAWDGRDDPINTRRGAWASLSLQEGMSIGGYGYRYLRFTPEARFYWRAGSESVLAARARLGALVPIAENDAAPVMALYSSGGALVMRAYGPGRFSPMELQDGRWVPIGGNGVVDGTLELRTPFGKSLGGVIFLEAGNVSEPTSVPSEWRTVLDPTLLQVMAGIGVRYKTPFGPLRVDAAAKVPTDWSAGVPFDERFPPVPGTSGHREPIGAIHLTLGEAF
jgi:translocation and assembly module TamA